jgi:hypothetical protein
LNCRARQFRRNADSGIMPRPGGFSPFLLYFSAAVAA